MTRADEATDSAPAERAMSIGTWNMDHWRRTIEQRRDGWSFLHGEARA